MIQVPAPIPTDKLILTDVDNVLVRWGDGFDRFIRGVLGRDPVGHCDDFERIAHWLGIEQEEVYPLISTYHHDHRGLLSLEAYEDAACYVPLLAEAGWRFIAVSALRNDGDAEVMRRENLRALFGDAIVDLHLTGGDKSAVLAAYPSAVWVEDAWKYALQGHAAGHRTFLIERPYNRGVSHDGPTVVNGWNDIYSALVTV
jgi:hypothetical protein